MLNPSVGIAKWGTETPVEMVTSFMVPPPRLLNPWALVPTITAHYLQPTMSDEYASSGYQGSLANESMLYFLGTQMSTKNLFH